MVSDNTDMRYHVQLAEKQKQFLYTTRIILRDISGMLMMISKRTWLEHKFSEDKKCLGVDTEYGRRVRESGKYIVRMNGLYLWHTYRLIHGITHKEHLR
jgi:GT2 family glycosyltransferase